MLLPVSVEFNHLNQLILNLPGGVTDKYIFSFICWGSWESRAFYLFYYRTVLIINSP